MTTEDMVVDVSQDWVLACDVQQRFRQGLGRTSNSVDYSARCRQVRPSSGKSDAQDGEISSTYGS
ncbi:MAG TPA: hypothetical protein VNV88_10935 [Candidatus Solibacter sp.]|jgi:hypothetical protein|nr:hypothetical protein [Candidatus Solibacter sp.]